MTSFASRACLTSCAVAASVFLLAACTSDDKDTAGPSPSAPRTTTSSATPPGASEQKLTKQVEAALEGFHDGTMVESGVERVNEGIHTEPLLTKGSTYRLNLACAGKGSAQLTFTPASAGERTTVPCDGSVVQQRLTADKPIRIDVNGNAGATGMVAWQIDQI
jgi:hypothetical protein